MKKWDVEFSEGAEDDVAGMDSQLRRRIIERLGWLSENFENITPLPLGNVWRGFFKFRVGDWRIIYRIDTYKKLIMVDYIDRRDRIYKCRR